MFSTAFLLFPVLKLHILFCRFRTTIKSGISRHRIGCPFKQAVSNDSSQAERSETSVPEEIDRYKELFHMILGNTQKKSPHQIATVQAPAN
jgi:hypothetical protein